MEEETPPSCRATTADNNGDCDRTKANAHRESAAVRSDGGTRSQTTVQTQLAVCGGWKNAGQKETRKRAGRSLARISYSLVHDLPIEVIQFEDDRSQTSSPRDRRRRDNQGTARLVGRVEARRGRN